MDPRATLIQLLQAVIDRDADALRESADNLAGWLEVGGFLPAAVYSALEGAQTVRDHAPGSKAAGRQP